MHLEAFDSVGTLPLEFGDVMAFGRRTKSLPFCRASAPGAFCQWRRRPGRRWRDSSWNSADHLDSGWRVGSAAARGSRRCGSRAPELGRGRTWSGLKHRALGRQPRSSCRFWRSCAASVLASQRWRQQTVESHPRCGSSLAMDFGNGRFPCEGQILEAGL